MTLCKVILYGLKPSDISYSSNDKITEVPFNNHHQQQEHLFTSDLSTHREEGTPSPETNYLNLQIKPLATPTYSVRNNYLILYSEKIINDLLF